MGKKAVKAENEGKLNNNNKKEEKEKEGHNLLGSPSYVEIGNSRLRCVETGHELPQHSKDSYSLTKHCRLGLINSALQKNKTPLNMFRQHPNSSSKLICKLTGDIVNKNEEHIWKHINGKRFFNMLERKEVEQKAPTELVEKKNEKGEKKKGNKNGKRDKKADAEENSGKKIKKKKLEKEVEREDSQVKDKEIDPEEDLDFWMPPVGQRWDNDDGGDRWGSDTEDDSADEKEEDSNVDNHERAVEVSKRKEPMSQEKGGSSKKMKKKIKKTMTEGCVNGTSSGLESSTTSS